MKKKKAKALGKDGFEHLNIYEDIITAAFRKSLESGNREARKYMAEQDAMRKAEEKKKKQAEYLRKAKARLEAGGGGGLESQHESVRETTRQTRETDRTAEEVQLNIAKREGLFSPNNMISRNDAMDFMSELITDFELLPTVLQENKLKADHLLFKEAQHEYIKRKKELEKQIIIDNVHFVTQQ